MATVHIPRPLLPLTGGVRTIEVQAGTLRQVIQELGKDHPAVVQRLMDGANLAPGLAVSIDGSFSAKGLLANVGPQSEVHFLPAIGGG